MSIIQFRRAKLLQDAKLSGVTVRDIARALATMDGVQSLSRFDEGFTSDHLKRRPVPLHSLQLPSIAPASDLLPVPAQARQEVALCP